MIRRRASNKVESLVNTANEEHYNVTKAIRDDAPVTNNVSVLKSINFESDGDGAYKLRKPLVKKESLNSQTSIHLFDGTTLNIVDTGTLEYGVQDIKVLTVEKDGVLQYLKLKWIDNNLKETFREEAYATEYIHKAIRIDSAEPQNWVNDVWHPPGIFTVQTTDWITLNLSKALNTSDHTLIPVTINHPAFLYRNVSRTNQSAYSWYWNNPLVNTSNASGSSTFGTPESVTFQTTHTLKRFIKIYKDPDSDYYICEIIRPELNSITSGLDVGNAETLDVNLLADNPYAIRDLYGYGYVSTTKIVPYLVTCSNQYLSLYQVLSITEQDFEGKYDYPEGTVNVVSSRQIASINYDYQLQDNEYIVLKAFITTNKTNVTYYCCWERSKDDGITWEECPEFLTASESVYTDILVSDLTYAEFDKKIKEESLEDGTNYLVSKKVRKLLQGSYATTDYSNKDSIADRPDVLILNRNENNLSYKYRFQIYVKTNIPTPTPTESTFTEIGTYASNDDPTVEKAVGTLGHIYCIAETNQSDHAPEVLSSGKLVLYEASESLGTVTSTSGTIYGWTGVGNSLKIYGKDSKVKIKSVTLNIGASGNDYAGSAIGIYPTENYTDSIVSTMSTIYNNNTYNENISTENFSYHVPDMSSSTVYDRTYAIFDCYDLWVEKNSSRTYSVNEFSTVYFTNISRHGKSALIYDALANTTDLEYDDVEEYDTAQHSLHGNTNITKDRTLIDSFSVTYVYSNIVQFTDTYLSSTTGAFQIPTDTKLTLVEDLSKERAKLFGGELYYIENQAQLMSYNGNSVYVSDINSSIMKLMNTLTFPNNVTKIISWRGYLLFFTEKQIYLAKYDVSSNTYSIKLLTSTVGVSIVDADTVVPILNSVYFKSGNKIYKLVPNLYASSDDILNIHQVSTGVNNLLTEIVDNNIETHNIGYSDSDVYYIFIPVTDKTLCLIYDFVRQLWNYYEYPIVLTDVLKLGLDKHYLYDNYKLYHFKENFDTLLNEGLKNTVEPQVNLAACKNVLSYADYLNSTPTELITLAEECDQEDIAAATTRIYFYLDFGQKSSNYTLDKQFLETKMILATLSAKDTIPLGLDIYTDGVSRVLHIDANTDGAVWKTAYSDVGILNTDYQPNGADYNNIFRQLIVKYSGRGKSIRHVLSGYSHSLFKFYSMDVRGRILPKKH